MDGYPRYEISVLEPLNWALSWTKRVLFSPFDISKWLVIGFCAFLSTCGEGGGGGSYGGGWEERGGSVQEMGGEVERFFSENLPWIIPVAILLFVLIIGISLLLLWLRSRGKFMFLYCVARDTAEAERPWSFFARQGNSLFLFLLLLGLATFAAMIPFIGGSVFAGITLERSGVQPQFIGLLVFCIVMMIGIGIAAAIVSKFTKDFVVPIMYLRQNTVTEAWREFGGMLGFHKGRFALYILFQIVIHLAIGALVFAVALITCCCAACILWIPYIGTVLYLPVLVFLRSYSAFYLAQFGPAYNVFMPPPEGEPAVTPEPQGPPEPPA